MSVCYSNGKVTWLGGPLKYWTFWTINRLFQLGLQTTIWIPDHLTTGQKYTIWKPDLPGIQMVCVYYSELKWYDSSLYRNHLNHGQVWYSNGPNVSSCQMVWFLNGGRNWTKNVSFMVKSVPEAKCWISGVRYSDGYRTYNIMRPIFRCWYWCGKAYVLASIQIWFNFSTKTSRKTSSFGFPKIQDKFRRDMLIGTLTILLLYGVLIRTISRVSTLYPIWRASIRSANVWSIGTTWKKSARSTSRDKINVTSFSSISCCSNSEYWTQKHTQNSSIHSIIVNVYAER